MDCNFQQLVMLASLFTAALTRIGSGLRLLAEPQSFSHVKDNRLKITCETEEPLSKEIIRHFEITKVGFSNPILAISNDEAISTGPSFKSNMEAKGNIDRNSEKPYISLTINNPSPADAGFYTCRMFYCDSSYTWYEEYAKINVTFVAQEASSMMNFLFEKVVQLETDLRQQNDIITRQDRALQRQVDINLKLHKALEQQDAMSDSITRVGLGTDKELETGVSMKLDKVRSVDFNMGYFNVTSACLDPPIAGKYLLNIAYNQGGTGKLDMYMKTDTASRYLGMTVEQGDVYNGLNAIHLEKGEKLWLETELAEGDASVYWCFLTVWLMSPETA